MKDVFEWAKDDMFQKGSCVGGFDADEMEFCFSYYDKNHKEFWFQLNLVQISDIVASKLRLVDVHKVET